MSIIAGLAPAKINVSLRVVGRRADGFHDIDSTVVFLDLCDSLLLSHASPGTQELHITGQTGSIPADDTNLVLRAAAALTDFTGRDLPFSAVLDKQIPAGAGLGGGSSDAATTLLGLAEPARPGDRHRTAATGRREHRLGRGHVRDCRLWLVPDHRTRRERRGVGFFAEWLLPSAAAGPARVDTGCVCRVGHRADFQCGIGSRLAWNRCSPRRVAGELL